MGVYTYSSKLSDLGLGMLTAYQPKLSVRPVHEAIGPEGPVSGIRKQLTVTTNGSFSFPAFASADLSPATDYVLELVRFEAAADGSMVPLGYDVWQFTAVVGGGNIADMRGASLYSLWIGGNGVPWPDGTPPGLYFDLESPNEWGVKR